MEEKTTENYLDLLSIPELCDKKFFIPEYQRGFRWGELQIKQLLEDLYFFFYNPEASGDFYCLQPIVVKKMSDEQVRDFGLSSEEDNNSWYEVIDGQQRLTTINIILILLYLFDEDNKLRFPLYYKTRPALRDFFSKFQKDTDDKGKYIIKTDVDDGKLDIDSWHILKAANKIITWFQTETNRFKPSIKEFKGTFNEYFTNGRDKVKSVQVVWYELRDGSDPYGMFKRLNDKKVSLNNAELIRAMFLSDSASYKCDEELLRQFDEKTRPIERRREQARKESHIIEMWDIIENNLRNAKFWAFIKDDNDSSGYSCRIEYIFDLISKKTKEKDPLHTYLEFDRLLKDGEVTDLWELWMKVESYCFLLKYWFENSYYYHRIGYLITVLGPSVLMDLLTKYSTLSKSDFNEDIYNKIDETIKIKGSKKTILEYSYEEDYDVLKKVLILYNVMSVAERGNDFFPFDKFKKEKNWTLEHIHAQNSELIDRNDKKKWMVWFESNLDALSRLQIVLQDNKDLQEIIGNIQLEKERLDKNSDKFSFNDLTVAFDMILNFFKNLNKNEEESKVSHGVSDLIHGIANMALLGGTVNTSIGNTVFEVKRQRIMEADANGEYIPLCTRNVFLKYYNYKKNDETKKDSEDNNKNDNDFTVQQNFYWSVSDRENYLRNIEEILKEYIKPGEDNSDSEHRDKQENGNTNE